MQLCWFSPLVEVARHAQPLSQRGGRARFRSVCSSRISRVRANHMRTGGVPARARARQAFATSTNRRADLQVFSRKPSDGLEPSTPLLTIEVLSGKRGQVRD